MCGSRGSIISTVEADSTVRGRIQSSSRPTSVSSSASCSAVKQRVIDPSGQGTSSTSALGAWLSSGQQSCSASSAMPSTTESTHSSVRPPGRSTRAISPREASVARWRESTRLSATTESKASEAKLDRNVLSATTGRSRPGACRGGVRACPLTRVSGGRTVTSVEGSRVTTSCPAATARWAPRKSGLERSSTRPGSAGSHRASWASATAQ
jgi:hypothetical protein